MEAKVESRGHERNESRPGGGLSGALWLAREDVRRTWISYPASCVALFLVGFGAIGLVEGIFEFGGSGREGTVWQEGFNGFFTDFFFLSVCPALGINLILNRDYGARYRYDNMSRRLAFLRSLAISAGEIVAGRALTMLLFFVVATPAFFLPLFLVSSDNVERFPGVAEFWSFAVIWVGYALFAGGFYMYAWLGFSGREDLKGTLTLVLVYLLAAALSNFVFGIHLVAGSIRLAGEYGPLVAVPVLAAGATGFLFWCRVTRRRLERRDLAI